MHLGGPLWGELALDDVVHGVAGHETAEDT